MTVLAIRCRNLTRSFLLEHGGALHAALFGGRRARRFVALSDVTFTAQAGEFVGVLGRNGAGKSTLLRVLGGVYAPDSGTVEIYGALSAIYELGVTGNDLLTGRQFAVRWFDVFGAGGRRNADAIAEAHEFSELGDAFDRPIRGYSAGMKARLFFALSTALPADVYIIDEVLAVGDEYFQNKCWRRLRQRLGAGAGGVVATHDWAAILRLCPRSVILEQGSIVAEGRSSDIVRQYLDLDPGVFARGARFLDAPTRLTAHTFEDFVLDVRFEATEAFEWRLGFAVERFIAGAGWEHVLHADPVAVGEGPGVFAARIDVPAAPLPAGAYAAGLFLLRRGPDGVTEVVDARSWTYGNGVDLDVVGAESRAALRRPLQPVFEPLRAPEKASA